MKMRLARGCVLFLLLSFLFALLSSTGGPLGIWFAVASVGFGVAAAVCLVGIGICLVDGVH